MATHVTCPFSPGKLAGQAAQSRWPGGRLRQVLRPGGVVSGRAGGRGTSGPARTGYAKSCSRLSSQPSPAPFFSWRKAAPKSHPCLSRQKLFRLWGLACAPPGSSAASGITSRWKIQGQTTRYPRCPSQTDRHRELGALPRWSTFWCLPTHSGGVDGTNWGGRIIEQNRNSSAPPRARAS